MNSLPVTSQMYLTFDSLDANAMFTLKAVKLLNSNLDLLMVYLLDMPQTLMLIGSTTYPPGVLKESMNVEFDEDNGSQAGYIDHDDAGDDPHLKP